MSHPQRELLLRFWDEDRNEKHPEEVSLYSRSIAYFKCNNGHQWKNKICNQARTERCQECQKLCVKYPEIAEQWHALKNAVDVKDVYAGSAKKYYWKCLTCCGETYMSVENKVSESFIEYGCGKTA